MTGSQGADRNVRKLVLQWLIDNGYDFLYFTDHAGFECRCSIYNEESFMQCESPYQGDCVPFKGTTTDEATALLEEWWNREPVQAQPKTKKKGKRKKKKDTEVKNPCSLCGAELVLRESKYGKFYGCSTFPKCKGKKNYEEKDNG